MECDANDHAARTGWAYDEQGHAYIRSIGHCTARLWEDENGRWMTQVTSGYRGISGNGYPTMVEAQAWCEDQAAQFIASDSRFNDSEAGT